MNTVDPYQAGMFKSNPYAAKVEIKGKLVVILDGTLEDRNLQLMKPISRALCRNEIHELILTDEKDAGPGQIVNSIAYLGFIEVEQGGVLVTGDNLFVGNTKIGEIVGFDETHMPNHLNIIVKSEKTSGKDRRLVLGMQVVCSTA